MIKVRIILLAGLLAAITMAGCRSAHTTAAILYIDEQNYDKAVEVIHEGFQYVDNEPDAYYYLGTAYSHLAEDAVATDNFAEAKKNYSLAYEAFKRTVEIDSAQWTGEVSESLKYNYNQRLMQARRDWDEKFFEQAEGHLRLAYAALPDSTTPVKYIAQMKMQIAQNPDNYEQKTVLLEEALVLLDQVLVDNPDAYLLRFDKANVLARLERNDEARAIFDDLLNEHGDDTALLIDVANLAISDGDFERAADFYVRVVDIRESDTLAENDAQNKEMLVSAGKWYSTASIGRYADAVAVLDRAANLEIHPTEDTMLTRLATFYSYGKNLKDRSEAETDPATKADLLEQANYQFNRAVDVGNAMTQIFTASKNGFFYLAASLTELGDFAAAEANFKAFQELDESGNR